MAAYTYWKLVFGYTALPNLYIKDVYFISPLGVDNVSVGGTATSTSPSSGSTPVTNAFARNGTYWDPGNNNPIYGANIQFQHSTAVEVQLVNVKWHYWLAQAERRTNMELYASNDGSTYDRFGLINIIGPIDEPGDSIMSWLVIPYETTATAPKPDITHTSIRFAGGGSIVGHIRAETPGSPPLYARVTLLSADDRTPAAETWTDPVTGAYAFTGLSTTERFLLAVYEQSGGYMSRLTREVFAT